jgi:hypothetical protein
MPEGLGDEISAIGRCMLMIVVKLQLDASSSVYMHT